MVIHVRIKNALIFANVIQNEEEFWLLNGKTKWIKGFLEIFCHRFDINLIIDEAERC